MKHTKKIIAAVCSAALAVSALALNASAAKEKSWQELYASFLRSEIKSPTEYPDGFDAFSIYDLDADGTPELIISQADYHGAYCTICTVSDGKVTRVGDVGSYGEFAYIPSKKYIVSSYMGMGYLTVSYFEMNGTELKMLVTLEDDSGNAESDADINYTIDEKTVTEEEYDRKFDEMGGDSISLGRTFPLSENAVIYAVEGTDDYKAAYGSLLYGRYLLSPEHDSKDTFTLMNIIGDKTPELIVNHWSGSSVFTFRDGRVQYLGDEYVYPVGAEEPSYAYKYNSANKIFMIKVSSPKDKGYAYTFYSTKGNKLTQKAEFRCGTDLVDNRYVYMIDGREVSKEKYTKALKKYTSMKYSTARKTYEINEENLKKALG
ncbi:MAG: hypothetical protein K6C13_06305 [Oscillospiraceae bacterium]|nr:hypothetical protein [Oscillospiraceae bacterium]